MTLNFSSPWIALVLAAPAPADRVEKNALATIPAGYHLQTHDDCGVTDRQPHVPAKTKHTFAPSRVNADLEARTVTYGVPHFDVVFDDLDADLPYALAVTYASEKGNRRVQSLTAGTVTLHGPHVLSDGAAEKLLFKLPSESIRNGRLVLHFTCDEGHNAVASVVALWAPKPSPEVLHLELRPSLTGQLAGTVSGLDYQGMGEADISVRDAATGKTRASTTSNADGVFTVDTRGWIKPPAQGTLNVVARIADQQAKASVPYHDLYFLPPRFHPMPELVSGPRSPRIRLDGQWRIHPAPPADFQSTDCRGEDWKPFAVPGQWLQQGVDVPRDQTVGVATEFEIPPTWTGHRLFLRFDSVHAGTEYWLNGRHLGDSENLYTPVQFDVTDAVHLGQANRLVLAMRVDTPSELASYSSNYAFHNLGGIDRSVWLFALPRVHLAQLHHETLLDEAGENATLVLHARVANTGSESVSDLSMRVSLQDPDHQPVHLDNHRIALEPLAHGETVINPRFAVPHPATWNAEKPHLYKLTVSLHQGETLLQRVEREIGFRRVEVKDGQLLINGRPVKLAGVNRHEIDPVTGRAATARHADDDVRLLRAANFNYIRTSHYPPTREFLEACDRRGVYVQCEAPFCWTRTGRGEDDPRLMNRFLTPVAAMLEACRHHPSIILWSIANESGHGPDGPNALDLNFTAALDFCRREDPSRPVVFNNEWARDGGKGDLATIHYPPFPPEEYEYVKDDPRPILLDEYFPPQTFTFAEELEINPGLDVVNWSTGQNSSTSWWSRIVAAPRVAGGAIWAGIDEQFQFADGTVKGYGPWGFLDVWRRPKSLWWDAKRIHAPIWIPLRRVDFPGDDRTVTIPIENRYAFTDLSELRCEWRVGAESGPFRLNLAPTSKGELRITLPATTPEGSLLVLRFSDAHGELVTAHGVTLGNRATAPPPEPTGGAPKLDVTDAMIRVQGTEFELVIDRATGKIRPGGATRLQRLPVLHVTRRETKNVFNPGGLPYAQYPDQTSRTLESITAEPTPSAVRITVRDRFEDFAGSIEMLLDTRGRAKLSFDYTYTGEPFAPSELGLRLVLDEACRQIAWHRRTEWDVYPDDHIGRPEGQAAALPEPSETHVTPPPYRKRPPWPWHLDPSPRGTRDFRATKYHIYQADLTAPDTTGIRAISDATTHVRACLVPGAVRFHTLTASPPAKIDRGAKLSGTFFVQWLTRPVTADR